MRAPTCRTASLRRQLDGWPLIPATAGVALLAAALAVPRPVEPTIIPLPHVDRLEAERFCSAESARARAAHERPLPYEVRAVGEAFRAYGQAHSGMSPGGGLREVQTLAREALARVGPDPLLTLRAVQTNLFIAALEEWDGVSPGGDALRALGGNFAAVAVRNGWAVASRGVVLAEEDRRTLFRMRWNDVTGLREHPAFRPTDNEWRSYYRLLLRYPERKTEARGIEEQQRLAYISAVARHDPTYPANLARGVVYQRLGAFGLAASALETHLAEQPDGPWRLRAQNYLAAALVGARGLEEP